MSPTSQKSPLSVYVHWGFRLPRPVCVRCILDHDWLKNSLMHIRCIILLSAGQTSEWCDNKWNSFLSRRGIWISATPSIFQNKNRNIWSISSVLVGVKASGDKNPEDNLSPLWGKDGLHCLLFVSMFAAVLHPLQCHKQKKMSALCTT